MTPSFHEFAALGPHGFTRIAYVEWGPRDAAQTVVCAHGLSRNSRDFDELAQRLAEQGVRVVAPDLPGRGRSAWLSHPEDYDTPLYLSAMAALIARLNVRQVDWLGTSLGGFIGMHLAAQPGTPIRRLVLNDFGARVPASVLHRLSSNVGVNPRFDAVSEADAYLRRVHAPFGELTDAQWKHIVKHSTVKLDDGRFRLHHDPAIAKQFSWPLMLDVVLWQVWEKVACPVLILRGADSDLLLGGIAREMQQRGIAASEGKVQLVEFAGCGHAPSLLVDEHIAPVVSFLLAAGKGASTERRAAMAGNLR